MRHRLILFDNDGTLNTQFSCWRYIAQPIGIFEPQGRRLLEEHLNGIWNYEEFARKTVALWKGLDINVLEAIIDNISLRNGSLTVLNYFREHGYKVCAVSSGFDLWKSIFQRKYDFVFDDFLANHLVVDTDGILTGDIEIYVTDFTKGKNKGNHLKTLATKYNLDHKQIIMVGDGLGDINGFQIADISFAVAPSDNQVADAATHVIGGESLSSLLDYFNDGEYVRKRSNQKGSGSFF
jgi:HAD superfamily phosphoserine phosphatase-like hydrolase